MIRSTSRFAALVACAALVAAACNQLPTRKGNTVESPANSKIETASPVDVAVLPIVNATGSKKVPSKELREALEAGLVQRRYTPLATEFVDAQVTDAAFRPGSLREDATLQVTIGNWDDSLWATHTAVTPSSRRASSTRAPAPSSGRASSIGASTSARIVTGSARTRR